MGLVLGPCFALPDACLSLPSTTLRLGPVSTLSQDMSRRPRVVIVTRLLATFHYYLL
jgi:hypothetical protein